MMRLKKIAGCSKLTIAVLLASNFPFLAALSQNTSPSSDDEMGISIEMWMEEVDGYYHNERDVRFASYSREYEQVVKNLKCTVRLVDLARKCSVTRNDVLIKVCDAAESKSPSLREIDLSYVICDIYGMSFDRMILWLGVDDSAMPYVINGLFGGADYSADEMRKFGRFSRKEN